MNPIFLTKVINKHLSTYLIIILRGYTVAVLDSRCGERGRDVILIMINDVHSACILSKCLFKYAPGTDESKRNWFYIVCVIIHGRYVAELYFASHFLSLTLFGKFAVEKERRLLPVYVN